jgi:hypothetical protein
MKLTEAEEQQAAKNRQFMRHMTASFWGFILIAILSLFVWAKVEKWMGSEGDVNTISASSMAKVELFIHPEDEAFWTLSKPELTELIAGWKQQNVQRVWLPISVQSTPFFKSKALKYSLDKFPSAIEYEWYQKAVFPMVNELIADEEITIGGYFWNASVQKPKPAFSNFVSNEWFIENTSILNTKNDSVFTYLKALADESIVSWKIDSFALVTDDLSNSALLNPEIEMLNKALQRHQISTKIQHFEPSGNGFEHSYMSVSKWARMPKDQKSNLLSLGSSFLVVGSDTSSVILY